MIMSAGSDGQGSLGPDRFSSAQRVPTPDDESGPRLVFDDGTETIRLADMSGDGLTDIARIRRVEVAYWPNPGYGRFAAKVTMDDATRLKKHNHEDADHIMLADIDGTGSTDIVYLHEEGPRLHFNQAGKGWSAPLALRAFPIPDALGELTLQLNDNSMSDLRLVLTWGSQ